MNLGWAFQRYFIGSPIGADQELEQVRLEDDESVGEDWGSV